MNGLLAQPQAHNLCNTYKTKVVSILVKLLLFDYQKKFHNSNK